MKQDEEFKAWWYSKGSQAPYTHHDCEEHTMRMCEIAWENGAYKEREACAKMVEDYMKETAIMEARGCLASVAYDIRARGEA